MLNVAYRSQASSGGYNEAAVTGRDAGGGGGQISSSGDLREEWGEGVRVRRGEGG